MFIKRLPSVKKSNRLTLNALGSIGSERSRCKYTSAKNSPKDSVLERQGTDLFSQASTAFNTPYMSPYQSRQNSTKNLSFLNKSRFINASFDTSTLDERSSQPELAVKRKAKRRILMSSFRDISAPRSEKRDFLKPGTRNLVNTVKNIKDDIQNIYDDFDFFVKTYDV